MSLDARSSARPVIICGCDPILLSGVLVNPLRLEPFLGIGFVGRDQVEALGVGAGRGEVLGLRWVDVDRNGGRILLPQTKNGDGRVVYLNRLACQVLDCLRAGAPTDHIFPASDDVTPESVSLAFLRACRKVGIADFRLHDLRHTAASWLRMQGADIHTVALLLGHKDLRMAARYQHLTPAHLADAPKRLDDVFPNLPQMPAKVNGDGAPETGPSSCSIVPTASPELPAETRQ